MLDDGGELALIDVREELIFSQNHLLLARSVPLSRFELRFAPLVPRRSTPIVLCDDNDGLADRAAAILARNGYAQRARPRAAASPRGARRALSCSPASMCRARRSANISSMPTARPASPPPSSKRSIRDGADLVVLDSRPFDEFFARVDPDRDQRARRRTGFAHARHRAVTGYAGGRQLRRPHPQHHRRAIADQCRPAEQGGGAAQRHHGLEPRRLYLRAGQEPARARRFASDARLGAKGGATGGGKLRRQTHRSCDARRLARRQGPHALHFRRARSG